MMAVENKRVRYWWTMGRGQVMMGKYKDMEEYLTSGTIPHHLFEPMYLILRVEREVINTLNLGMDQEGEVRMAVEGVFKEYTPTSYRRLMEIVDELLNREEV